MFGRRFEKDKKLIEDAIANEEGEKNIRKHLKPLVERLVSEHILQNPEDKSDEENLNNAGWSYLSMAMKRYLGRVTLMEMGKNDIYYFSSYFDWFIRQGILDYLKKRNLKTKDK